MELETDKAVVEVPSSVSGTVQEIRVKEGDKIKVGQVIFTVDGAEAKAPEKPSTKAAAATPSPTVASVHEKPPAVSTPPAPPPPASAATGAHRSWSWRRIRR
jgi:pyruvate dehydrogenase E2 component (dihydrolipoamide acetyltransferase)